MLNNLCKVGWKLKNADIISYMLTPLVSLQQGNVKKSKKLMKIVNIDRENLHIIWTTWEKMWLMTKHWVFLWVVSQSKRRIVTKQVTSQKLETIIPSYWKQPSSVVIWNSSSLCMFFYCFCNLDHTTFKCTPSIIRRRKWNNI